MTTKILIIIIIILLILFSYNYKVKNSYIDLKKNNLRSKIMKYGRDNDTTKQYKYYKNKSKKCELYDDFFLLYFHNLDKDINFTLNENTFSNKKNSSMLILNDKNIKKIEFNLFNKSNVLIKSSKKLINFDNISDFGSCSECKLELSFYDKNEEKKYEVDLGYDFKNVLLYFYKSS